MKNLIKRLKGNYTGNFFNSVLTGSISVNDLGQ